MFLTSGTKTTYDKHIVAPNRDWSAKLYYYYNGSWYSLGTTNLQSLQISDYSTDGSNITMGTVVGGKLTVNLIKVASSVVGRLTKGTAIKIKLTLNSSAATSGITLTSRVFVIDDSKLTLRAGGSYNVSLTAYDFSYKMTDKFVASASKMTAKEILTQIADKYGFTIGESVDSVISEFESVTGGIQLYTPIADTTCKQTIGYMAGCYGCFAYFDEELQLQFAWYESNGDIVDSSRIFNGNSYVSEMEEREIVMLETGTTDNPIVVPNNAKGFSINFENPYITQTQSEAIYNKRIADGKLIFKIGKLSYRGNPLNSPGAIISVKDINRGEYPFYIMKRTLRYDGGLSETIECLGESETTINYKLTSPTQQKIDRALSKMEEAIKNATDIITQTKGSVFEVIPIDENNPPKGNSGWKLYSTEIGSNNLILANSSGIGFSSNGGQSFNAMAMYIDENGIGHINANCIDVGKLSANVIDTSTLVVGGGSYDDLETLLNGVVETSNNSITKVDVLYGKNQSTTTPPTSWSTDAPVWENGYYIWTKTQTTAGGVTSETQPVCITGAKGSTGATGAAGANGLGISKIEEQYYLSTSSTSATGGSWSTNQPEWSKNKYIWTRSKVTWEDNTVTYTDAVLAKAINGANETANSASSKATSTSDILDSLTEYASDHKTVVISGGMIAADSIGASQIRTGSITADKLNVGLGNANYAATEEWDGDVSYLKYEFDSSYSSNVKMISSATSTEKRLHLTKHFYASKGSKIFYNAIAYADGTTNSANTYIGIGLYYQESNGSWTNKGYATTVNKSLKTEHKLTKEYTVSTDGYFRIDVWFSCCNTNAYLKKIYVAQGMPGEMLVNGVISSVNGNSYFDLNNNILRTDNAQIVGGSITIGGDDYNTKIAGGSLEQTLKSGTIIGGLVPVGSNGAYQGLYFKENNAKGIHLGYQNSSGNFNYLFELTKNKVYASVPIQSEGTAFSGLSYTRDFGSDGSATVKAGVGVWANLSNDVNFDNVKLNNNKKSYQGYEYYITDALATKGSYYGLTKWISVNGARTLDLSFNYCSYGFAYFCLVYQTSSQIGTVNITIGEKFLFSQKGDEDKTDGSYYGSINIPSNAKRIAIYVTPENEKSSYWAGWRNVSISLYYGKKTSCALELLDSSEQTESRIDVASSDGEAVAMIRLRSAKGNSGVLELGSSDFWFNGTAILEEIKSLNDRVSALGG